MLKKKALQMHEQWAGKIEIVCNARITNREELSIAYTPGVAEPCLAISENTELSYKYTRRNNLVAVITDGTAVLGLGDIGPEAGMPVMEGKCALFKTFANVDAFPLCLRTKSVDEIVNTVKLLEGNFAGINLEDISAPRCFEIERRLRAECDIPVFHDDQHGTAIVTLAAMLNALKIVDKDIHDINVVINGCGAAGIAIAKLLMSMGLEKVILCDRAGAVFEGRESLNDEKMEIALISNLGKRSGKLSDVIKGADVFIGVSAPNALSEADVRSMAKDAIIFAMANPVPEIMPDVAIRAGAKIVGTGRSDFANQINNVLAFPGIFRGALDVRASDINDEMKIAAAKAIAEIIEEDELTPEYIIPDVFDKRVAVAVASAVADAAVETGVARLESVCV